MYSNLVCALCLLIGVSPDRSGDLQVVLEWDGTRPSLFTLQQMEETCSSLLSHEAQLAPSDVEEVYLRRGEARLYLRKDAEAISDVNRVLRARPKDYRARSRLATILLDSEATRSRGMSLARELMAETSDRAPAYFLAGMYYFDGKDYQTAITYFSDAIKRDTKYNQAYWYRAESYFNVRDYHRCLADVRTALTLPPVVSKETINVQLLHGASLVRLGRFDDAQPVLMKAHHTDPKYLSVSIALWICLMTHGDYGSAFRLSQEMAEGNPDDAQAQWMYAMLLARAGHLPEALKRAERAADLDPKNEKAWSTLGRIRAMTGIYDGAARAYAQVWKIRGALDVDTGVRFAFLLATCPDRNVRNGEKAREFAEESLAGLKESYNRRVAMTVLAAAHAECGDFPKAAKTAAEAMKITPLDAQTAKRYEKLIELFKGQSSYRHDAKKPEDHLFDLPPAEFYTDSAVPTSEDAKEAASSPSGQTKKRETHTSPSR